MLTGTATATSAGIPSTSDPTLAEGEPAHPRFKMLDGWRALSIVLVLAAHMLPLGPQRWALNVSIGINGMAIFFALSGFLIVSVLLRNDDVISFLIRRFARILPLAWTALAISFAIQGVQGDVWLANFMFYANLPPFWLVSWSSHYWSLCVEMQFYVLIALVVSTFGRRGLLLIPIASIIITIARISTGTEVSIVTWFRLDEILSGGLLALLVQGRYHSRAKLYLSRFPFWPIFVLFLMSSRPEFPWLEYVRPYLAALMIGITIARPVSIATPLLESAIANYIARISFALYIIHHFTLFGWFTSDDSFVKYLKRPISMAISLVSAHLSTFYFEDWFILRSKRWASRRAGAIS